MSPANRDAGRGAADQRKSGKSSISDEVVAALSQIDADDESTPKSAPARGGRRLRRPDASSDKSSETSRGGSRRTASPGDSTGSSTDQETVARSGLIGAVAAKVAAVQQAAPANPPAPAGRKAAVLRIQTVNPYSVARLSFFVSVALGVVSVIAVTVMWTILNLSGVWDSINNSVSDVLGGDDGAAFDVRDYVGTGRVLGFTFIVAVVNVFLITGIGWLLAFLYNAIAALSGGIVIRVRQEN